MTELVIRLLARMEFAIVMATEAKTPFVALNKEDAEDLYRILKENTAEVEIDGGGTYWFVCGECRTAVGSKDKYCRECGRRLIWDGVYLKTPGTERVPDDLRSEGEEREQEPGEP